MASINFPRLEPVPEMRTVILVAGGVLEAGRFDIVAWVKIETRLKERIEKRDEGDEASLCLFRAEKGNSSYSFCLMDGG